MTDLSQNIDSRTDSVTSYSTDDPTPTADTSPVLAVTLPLFGQHLIEASAGTGKTFTLTGIVVRLLIEAGYACDNIIASTFTRSAAAEMRERIKARLINLEKLLNVCRTTLTQLPKILSIEDSLDSVASQQDSNALHFNDLPEHLISPDTSSSDYREIKQRQLAQFFTLLTQRIEAQGLKKEFDDPVNQHLITWVAYHEFDLSDLAKKPLSETTDQPTLSAHALADGSNIDNLGDKSYDKLTSTLEDLSDEPTKLVPKRLQNGINFQTASHRTNTALKQLDRLFVGTLDSLCQKWLREFSVDTGYQPNIQISNNVETIILAIIHDQLRAFRANLAIHEPVVFELMYANNRLPKADRFLPAVTKALNFYSTPIDQFIPAPFDLSPLESLITTISEADSDALQPYADASFRLVQGMKSEKLHTLFDEAFTILKQVKQQGLLGVVQLTKEQKDWLQKVALCVENGSGFKVAFAEQKENFIAIPLIQLLAQLHHATQALFQHMDDLNQYFHRFICQYVKDRLPIVLEAQQLTTFSLQLARLNDTLASKQGESLARYIRHQYPVALIDESQDINTEQAMLIQRIYLPDTLAKQNSLSKKTILEKNKSEIKQSKRQFLLLVGDPKQAIYGFRGGDVTNYTQLKAHFPPAQALTQNRRSSPAVIEALNHWFGKPYPDSHPLEQHINPTIETEKVSVDESQQAYFLGEGIDYRHIYASRKLSDLFIKTKKITNGNGADDIATYQAESQAIFLLKLENGQTLPTEKEVAVAEDTESALPQPTIDFSHAVTAQILALMDSQHCVYYKDETLYDEEGNQGKIRPLRYSDIAILADKNKQLDSLELALQAFNIPATRGGSQSLFAGEMTQDLIVLMQAILYPFDMTRLRRLLLSHFFDLSLEQVAQLTLNEHTTHLSADTLSHASNNLEITSLSDIQYLIQKAGKLWQNTGFLSAIQWLLHQETVLMHSNGKAGARLNFWQRLAQLKIGERLLIDLRQLLDIISQINGGGNELGEYQLLDWLEQQQNELPREEWSMQQRLPTDEGVQLMTIHNSKGLEFPIVFIVGLDKKITSRSEPYQLYLYTDDQIKGLQNRRLSPVPYRIQEGDKQADYFKIIESRQLYQEKLRLAYVALTRCRDRLYIVAQGGKTNEKDVPLNHWLPEKTFDLPEYLMAHIHQVDINSLSKYFNPNILKHYHAINKTSHESLPLDTLPQKQYKDYQKWRNSIQLTEFIGWSSTSFTALSRHLQHDKQDVAIHQPDYMFEDIKSTSEEKHEVAGIAVNQQLLLDEALAQSVRFTFEKGTNAGIFLHKILEILPPIQHPIIDEQGLLIPQAFRQWTPMIDRAISTHQISPSYLSDSNEVANIAEQHNLVGISDLNRYDTGVGQATIGEPSLANAQQPMVSPQHLELARWLYDITHTPLLASNLSLAQISPKQKIAELSFDMSLRQDFDLEAVNTLFKSIDIQLNLNTQAQIATYWRYLRGEIDLIYQAGKDDNQRFFIVDYKSNYLGNQFDLYDDNAMRQAMDTHGYWLQASIYQVALHRYLRLRLLNYDINRHLGAVEYVFLRGMSPDYPKHGKLLWQPSTQFILALDDILGKAGA